MGFFKSKQMEKISIISDCYTGSVVPNYTIEKVLGTIQLTRNGLDGNNVVDVVNDMFKSLVKCAEKEGADAVINVKTTTGSYEDRNEGGWIVSYITVYGEAVKLKYKIKD
jgi:hypothetical protein